MDLRHELVTPLTLALRFGNGPLPTSPHRHAAAISAQSHHSQWMRRVPCQRRLVGPSAVVPAVWARRLLRFFEKQARDEALPCDEAPIHPLIRAGRAVA